MRIAANDRGLSSLKKLLEERGFEAVGDGFAYVKDLKDGARMPRRLGLASMVAVIKLKGGWYAKIRTRR